MESFADLFAAATGFFEGPFRFQKCFAQSATLPALVRIPTGLGKTAMACLGWLWRRRFADKELRRQTPRRLVYCLPMRVLVEQTFRAIQTWLEKLSLADQIRVHLLMGGEQTEDWDLWPEREAILVGTQDMLLSRALNRGYAMSRYRWPMHFGLLNNDALWVFDEVQLMDVGVATSAQLEAFRRKLGTVLPVQSIWMSATLDPQWLLTVDADLAWYGEPFTLSAEDQRQPEIAKRYGARKRLQQAAATMGQEASIASEIAKHHQPGTLTLGIFNTVARARSVYEELKKQHNKGALPEDVSLLLIHSQFRPPDRARVLQQLLYPSSPSGTIAITTQVVEAGVDVSAATLFTELAPWASLVQRFGRCNRWGELNDVNGGRVFWIDLPDDSNRGQKLAAPYSLADLEEARDRLTQCSEVGPESLESIRGRMRLEPKQIIRRRDFIDLFDTTPDLAGNDIDVSRFIRSGEEIDVQVFWREVPKNVTQFEPEADYAAAPVRDELCAVPVYEFRDFLNKHRDDVWRWDSLNGQWVPVQGDYVFPGQTFLIRASAGGYSPTTGWDGKEKKRVEPVARPGVSPEAYQHDRSSAFSTWQTLAEHTDKLCETVQQLVEQLNLESDLAKVLLVAARWHDYGKAHPVFQAAVPQPPLPGKSAAIWAKAPGQWRNYERKHFRHELASAMAVLAQPHPSLKQFSAEDLNLVAYLTAAHHGKVRLSIRSLPGETTPDRSDVLSARGVWDGDLLPQVDLGGGVVIGPLQLTLQVMQLGRGPNDEPSWAERMLALRDSDRLGPIRLAYLEALLRAADMRVSCDLSEYTYQETGSTTGHRSESMR